MYIKKNIHIWPSKIILAHWNIIEICLSSYVTLNLNLGFIDFAEKIQHNEQDELFVQRSVGLGSEWRLAAG